MQSQLKELEENVAKLKEQSTNQQNLSQIENAETISQSHPKEKGEEKDEEESFYDLKDENDFLEEDGEDDEDFFSCFGGSGSRKRN